MIFSEAFVWEVRGRSDLTKLLKNLGTGGTIFLVQVAPLHMSNDSLQRMDGTRGQEAYFTGHRSTQGRYVD